MSLDGNNLAALFDAGELALHEGDTAAADKQFLKLLQYGAESDYAERLRTNHPAGFFLEKETLWWGTDLIQRAEYSYTLDLLDQEKFADRHSITFGLTAIRPSGHFLYGYWTTSFSQFDDDGETPSVDRALTYSTGFPIRPV